MTPLELYEQTQNLFRHQQRRFFVRMAKEYKRAGLRQDVLLTPETFEYVYRILWTRERGFYFQFGHLSGTATFGISQVLGSGWPPRSLP